MFKEVAEIQPQSDSVPAGLNPQNASHNKPMWRPPRNSVEAHQSYLSQWMPLTWYLTIVRSGHEPSWLRLTLHHRPRRLAHAMSVSPGSCQCLAWLHQRLHHCCQVSNYAFTSCLDLLVLLLAFVTIFNCIISTAN